VESVPGLSIAEEDILQPLALGAFDLVRAANVLNRVYFTPDVLRDMAASLWNRLLPDGMLLVVRSRSGFNNGTLFARSEGKSEIVARLGEGSEIEDIVLEASRQAHRTGPATA
jgi:chemotaxis methyl-accepting protein methylase